MKWARSDWILVALSAALGGYCAGMLGCLMFGGVVAALGRWKHVQLVVGTMFCTGLFIVALFLPRHGTVRVQTASITASPVGAAPASSTETSLDDWRNAQAAQWNQDVDSFVSVHADLSVGQNMQVMQAAIKAQDNPYLSNKGILELAYDTARKDARWTESPQLDVVDPFVSTTRVVIAHPASVQGDWNSAALAFETSHPDLQLGQNMQIMQHALDRGGTGQPASQLLQAAYVAAQKDSGWTYPQQ